MSNRHLYRKDKHAGKDKKKMKANGKKMIKAIFGDKKKDKKEQEMPQWFIDDINDMYDHWDWRRE